MSPLHYACKNGHKNVADFLISNIISDDVYLDKPDKVNIILILAL